MFVTALVSTLFLASHADAFADRETAVTNNARSYAGLKIRHAARQVVSDDQYADFNVLHHLTGISPYFDSPGVGLQPEPPQGCNVSAAAYLIRHGDIYANDFDYETYIQPFLEKLGNVTDKSIFANTPLAFLTNWSSPISNDSLVSQLTPLGAADAKTLGGLVQRRYPTLTNGQNITIWSATAERTLDTSKSFVEGFGNASIKEIDEGKNASANSLTPHKTCSNFDASKGSDESSRFREIYTQGPIKRFNSSINFNFTDTDIFAMQQLCGYETVIRNSSEFCSEGLFTPNEWLSFEYAQDIMYAYSLGYGLEFSPDLGMPWLEASTDLITTNESVPQKLFLSFTHREEPAFAMTALGLFNDSRYTGGNISQYFPSDSVNYNRVWKSSYILPFLGHVAIERLSCPSVSSEDYIRVLVNSAPVPLPLAGLQTGPGASAPISQFVDYVQQRAQTWGDFVSDCGDTESNATNTLSFYHDTLGVKLSSTNLTSAGGASSTTNNNGAFARYGSGSAALLTVLGVAGVMFAL